MRHAPNLRIDKYRKVHPALGDSEPGENYGFFEIPSQRHNVVLRAIASDGQDDECEGWEHVSVSLANRCPTWDEMCFVKQLFWKDDETVLQFHPPKSDYINNMPYCLHLWRKRNCDAPLPPQILV
jgi:hypothetical protein